MLIRQGKFPAPRIAAAVALAGLAAGCGDKNAYVAPPPPEVTVSLPRREAVTIYQEFTGNTRAIESVDLRARVRGFLKDVRFVAGSVVKAGDLLMVIEEEPFQVQVEQAKARLAVAEATLSKAEQSKAREVATAQVALDQAQLLLSQIEENRQRILVGRSAASKQEFDQAEANRKKAAAQVDADKANAEQSKADYDIAILSAKASIEQARADLRNAEINLGYCRVVAPINGRISRKLADVGNLVGDSQATVLATILQDRPIYAYMNVSEADILRFRDQVRKGERANYSKGESPVDLAMLNETGFPHHGRIDYAEPGVDPATGTVTVRGLFPNEDETILSGLFVRLRVPLEERKDALLVPERALGVDQGGQYLLLVDDQGVVEQRPVSVGSAVGEMRVIEKNLKATDRVVVNGLQKARPGLKVKAVEAKPSGEAAVAAVPDEKK